MHRELRKWEVSVKSVLEGGVANLRCLKWDYLHLKVWQRSLFKHEAQLQLQTWVLSISAKQIPRWRWIQRRQTKCVCACGVMSLLALWQEHSFPPCLSTLAALGRQQENMEGNHVTFKPGTLLDDLSICESRVNVINPLFNISGSLCNLCERELWYSLQCEGKFAEYISHFLKDPWTYCLGCQKITWVEMAGKWERNCQSIFFDHLMLHPETLIFTY